MGYYIPDSFWLLPFQLSGSILEEPFLALFMALNGVIGFLAWYFDAHVESLSHQLLGTVLGFLLVVMGNLSNMNYEKAVSAMNAAVQDGVNLTCEMVSHLPMDDEDDQCRAVDFRRLVCLMFRLMCYEVRADIQVKDSSNSWLDPNGWFQENLPLID
jgi:hypothetical protein